jgi:hypothetical protein
MLSSIAEIIRDLLIFVVVVAALLMALVVVVSRMPDWGLRGLAVGTI